MTIRLFNAMLALLFLFSFFGCEEKEYVIWEVDSDDYYTCNIGQQQEFFSNGDVLFTYTCIGDGHVEFFLDILSDQTDDNDYYQIYIDRNRNGIFDDQIDRVISADAEGEICWVFVHPQTPATPSYCFSSISGEVNFSVTENSPVDHFNVRVTMPIAFLTNTTMAKIHIKIWDDLTGWTSYPSESNLFQDTFDLQF